MIPKQAKKVFSGILFDIYQWEQEQFDGSVTLFEKASRPDSTEIIVTHDQQIYLQTEQQPGSEPVLTFPGGRVERGEEVLAAAQRELLEETGMTCQTWQEVSSATFPGHVEFRRHLFLATGMTPGEAAHESGEKIEGKWVSFEELIELVHQETLRILEPHFQLRCIRAHYDFVLKEELRSFLFPSV